MEEMIHVMNSQLLTFDVSSFFTKEKVCEGVIEALFIIFNSYLVRWDKKIGLQYFFILPDQNFISCTSK